MASDALGLGEVSVVAHAFRGTECYREVEADAMENVGNEGNNKSEDGMREGTVDLLEKGKAWPHLPPDMHSSRARLRASWAWTEEWRSMQRFRKGWILQQRPRWEEFLARSGAGDDPS